MQLSSRLPIDMLFFKHWHTDDQEYGFVLAKAAFSRRSDGRFRAEQERPEIRLAEEFSDGQPGYQSLLHDQEITPGKPATDLVIRAVARSPGGRAMSDWPVSATIPQRLHYGFHVRGPSEWRPGLLGWKLTAPELVQEVPLVYELAFGGAAPGTGEGEVAVHRLNPAGRGHATAERLRAGEPFAAPQIGELAEFIAADPSPPMQVHGFMPLAKTWMPRLADAGTFDETWQKERHPRMPTDYALRFWNAAPPPLQIAPHLLGHEKVVVSGISHAAEPVEVDLPGVGLAVESAGEGGSERQQMVLTSVDLDLRAPDPAEHRMEMIWHAMITQPGRFEAGEILGTRIEEV